jgi:hypothetical protein
MLQGLSGNIGMINPQSPADFRAAVSLFGDQFDASFLNSYVMSMCYRFLSIEHEMVDTVILQIKSSLENCDDVLISGVGKLGRNPATGYEMILDARMVVIFKCSGGMQEKLNGDGYKLANDHMKWLSG